VVTPPFLSPAHELQQRSLAEWLRRRFERDSRFLYDDLGTALRLTEKGRTIDGIHLNALATRQIAFRLGSAIAQSGLLGR
jgi:hypothetical protein